jgi:hypothetical protein
MAESNLATDDPGERYAALELAYTEDRWPDVLRQGESLIANLASTRDPLEAGLLSRAQLLLGHTHLYGLQNPSAALPYYQAVLASPAEPDLQQIAEAALPYCQPVASKASETDVPSPADVIAIAEVAADPAPLETEVPQPTANDVREPAEPFPAASSGGVEAAAMPFTINPLETTPTGSADEASQEAKTTVNAWPSLDPFQTTSSPEAQAVITAVATDSSEFVITESAAPWLDAMALQEEAEALRAQRAAERKSAKASEAGNDVELVEEPEQREVAQADPYLAEEISLEVAPSEETATPEELAQLMGDPELVDGLLRVMLTP